jgi:predicted alpha/beta superfamily hydrolase
MTSTEMAVNAARLEFTSSISNRDYRLFVSVPPGDAPVAGWPVVYLMDGNLHFGITVDTLRIQACWPETQNAVVVGIGYPTDSLQTALALRNFDLTPPHDSSLAEDHWMRAMGSLDDFGGQSAYLRMIEEEVKPLVAKHWPINAADQTLIGHSLGGLTCLTSMFTAPANFQHYAAISPSIWFNNRSVLSYVEGFEATMKTGDAKVRLFLSTGEYEEVSPMRPRYPAKGLPVPESTVQAMWNECAMVTLPSQLTERLKPLCGPNFDMKFVIHREEDHRSVVPAGIAGGIYFSQYRPD